MPAPIDISIWHSVWSVSKNKEQGHRIPLTQALLDFKVGYWGTMVLAVCFLTLGALVMYGTPGRRLVIALSLLNSLLVFIQLASGNGHFQLSLWRHLRRCLVHC